MSKTIAPEAEEQGVVTLSVHDNTHSQSHSEQWKEMRVKGRWVVGGVERWCIVLSVVFYH